MTTDLGRPTATIYVFPKRNLPAPMTARKQMSESRPNPLADHAIGGAWYHEAALREEHPRKS